MDVPHDRQQMGSPVGLRHRPGQSKTAAPERVSGSRESHPAGSPSRPYSPLETPARPRGATGVEALIVRFARENSGWGYDRIVGALANLGYVVSDQTVGNIL